MRMEKAVTSSGVDWSCWLSPAQQNTAVVDGSMICVSTEQIQHCAPGTIFPAEKKILLALCKLLLRPHLEFHSQFWFAFVKKKLEVEQALGRDSEMRDPVIKNKKSVLFSLHKYMRESRGNSM